MAPLAGWWECAEVRNEVSAVRPRTSLARGSQSRARPRCGRARNDLSRNDSSNNNGTGYKYRVLVRFPVPVPAERVGSVGWEPGHARTSRLHSVSGAQHAPTPTYRYVINDTCTYVLVLFSGEGMKVFRKSIRGFDTPTWLATRAVVYFDLCRC